MGALGQGRVVGSLPSPPSKLRKQMQWTLRREREVFLQFYARMRFSDARSGRM
jgi:hypothetical protein